MPVLWMIYRGSSFDNIALGIALAIYKLSRKAYTEAIERHYGVPGVSQVAMSPDCSPSFSAIWRCSDDPCVHDSGET